MHQTACSLKLSPASKVGVLQQKCCCRPCLPRHHATHRHHASKVSLPGNSHQKCGCLLICKGSRSNSRSHTSSLDGGMSFSKLPISQQSISMAFQVLDKDEDGRISRREAGQLVAYYLALQQHQPPSHQRRGVTWDQHLLSSIAAAGKLSHGNVSGVVTACEAFVCSKVSGGLQPHPPRFSDLVWAALGMASAMVMLGVLSCAAQKLPMVGQWHQQGAPLLLGSLGTLAILLFGKPEAEPVRLWSVIAGQLGAAAIAICTLQVLGANILSRAAAMAAAVTWMMWSDCIHPPGGALVLMAMDNVAIQQMSWAYLLWPSLVLTVFVLLPVSAATNWLRRNYQFDSPWAASGAVSLQQKIKVWYEQQAAKQAAVIRQYRALEIERAGGTPTFLHEELHSPLARLMRVLGPVLQPILQLVSLPGCIPRPGKSDRAGGRAAGAKLQNKVTAITLDLGAINLGSSIVDAGPAEEAAAAALDAAIRHRLSQEQERRLEDHLHKRRLWGDAANKSAFKRFEDKLNHIHKQRVQQQGQQPKGQQPQQQQTQGGQQPGQGCRSTTRQRLEQHWALKAQLDDSIMPPASDNHDTANNSTRSSTDPQQHSEGGDSNASGRSSSENKDT